MTVLFDDALLFLLDRGVQEIFPLLIFIILRPLGLTYGFYVFIWGFGNSRVIRASFSVAVGIPMVLGDFERISELLISAPFIMLVIFAITEVIIGLVLGIIGSLTFFAIQYAGEMSDRFRGESDSGIISPVGGSISTFGLLYTIIAITAFVTLNGFHLILQSLYRSYEIWPLGQLLPSLSSDVFSKVLMIFTDSLFLAIRIAAPLLILLLFIELATSFAAKIAQRFNFYNLAFPLKNLAAIGSLPVVAYYIWLLDHTLILKLFETFDLIR